MSSGQALQRDSHTPAPGTALGRGHWAESASPTGAEPALCQPHAEKPGRVPILRRSQSQQGRPLSSQPSPGPVPVLKAFLPTCWNSASTLYSMPPSPDMACGQAWAGSTSATQIPQLLLPWVQTCTPHTCSVCPLWARAQEGAMKMESWSRPWRFHSGLAPPVWMNHSHPVCQPSHDSLVKPHSCPLIKYPSGSFPGLTNRSHQIQTTQRLRSTAWWFLTLTLAVRWNHLGS